MHQHAQDAARSILDRMIEAGETGLQIAVYQHGRLVVDAWAGRDVDGRTLFPVYSAGKGFAATAIHILVERGVLAWDAPIARWWPEFAANGKAGITLRQILDHTAGMAMLPEHGTFADLADWDGMCRALAAMPPHPAPGSERHYHAVTFSWLLGETARRADGRPFARILDELIARPLGLDGMFFGVPDQELHRVRDVHAAPPAPADPAPTPAAPTAAALISARAIPGWIRPLEDMMNDRAVRQSCVPASNGIMNARSLARHYAALLGDGVDGVRLLSPATIGEATRPRPLPGETRAGFALGYAMQGPDADPGAVFGHGGYGGTIGFADRRHGLAVGFTRSRTNGVGGQDLIQAVQAALGCP